MMNQIQELIKQQPVITNLDPKEASIYKAGLLLLSSFVCQDFLDLPQLESIESRHAKDGRFYEIPYLQSPILATVSNKRDLLVVWEIIDGVASCPFRMSFEYQNENGQTNFVIYAHFQSDNGTNTKIFIGKQGSEYFTEMDSHDVIRTITLSECLLLPYYR